MKKGAKKKQDKRRRVVGEGGGNGAFSLQHCNILLVLCRLKVKMLFTGSLFLDKNSIARKELVHARV